MYFVHKRVFLLKNKLFYVILLRHRMVWYGVANGKHAEKIE